MDRYTTVDHLRQGDSALHDALAWHRANNPKLTDAEALAFTAGFTQAWRESRNALVLHKAMLPLPVKRERVA